MSNQSEKYGNGPMPPPPKKEDAQSSSKNMPLIYEDNRPNEKEFEVGQELESNIGDRLQKAAERQQFGSNSNDRFDDEEFDNEFDEKPGGRFLQRFLRPNRRSKKKRAPRKIISDVIFFVALGFMFFSAILWSRGSNDPIWIFQHTLKHVLTDSMEPDIPVGSLIIVRQVEPEDLREEDVITFSLDHRTTVTHQILNIWQNYYQGQIGFQTGNIDRVADSSIVLERNVIGRVVYSIPRLGAIVMFIPELISEPQNLIWLSVVFVVMIVLSLVIGGLLPLGRREEAYLDRNRNRGEQVPRKPGSNETQEEVV